MTIPRSEYPRPQFVRNEWACLNGPWSFAVDPGDSGRERGLVERAYEQEILVPFCPESKLSGIGNTDFLNAVWYRRDVTAPAAWASRDVWVHFQAVDYDATVFVNANEVCRHRGGWTPFSCNLAPLVRPGETFALTVRARDDHRAHTPKGKQASSYKNRGCHYTRTTGIWQTVWMEPLARVHMRRPRIMPDLAAGAFHLTVPLSQNRPGPCSKQNCTTDTGRGQTPSWRPRPPLPTAA